MTQPSLFLGLSGGVDSSVAAHLLQTKGEYRITAIFMKNWEEDDTASHCHAQLDLEDAQKVAHQLQIPFRMLNFAHEYWENVFTHFLSEYQAGRTPNPDILCNREIKFKAFLTYALQQGAHCIATGHYANTLCDDYGTWLVRAHDRQKDQSYFLHALDASALEKTVFPIGTLTKQTVRALARASKLPTSQKKDSTGICFIGERPFKSFLERYLPAQPGLIKMWGTDVVLGEHQGLMYHTLGQRQGLGIGGSVHGPGPWYVCGKDLIQNVLWVVAGPEHPALFRTQLVALQVHWIPSWDRVSAYLTAEGAAEKASTSTLLRCKAQVRYRQLEQACQVHYHPATEEAHITFDTPQRAITPGQSVVLYHRDRCLGGGIIA